MIITIIAMKWIGKESNYMKTKLTILITSIILILCTGCNYEGYDVIDTNYHFDKAIIKMPDGSSLEVEIEKWADAEDGEQLTITSKDGKRYLVNSVNCILVEEKNE